MHFLKKGPLKFQVGGHGAFIGQFLKQTLTK